MAYCSLCESNPCQCQRAQGGRAAWIIQACSTPRCVTSIRVRVGQQEAQPICKWCLRRQADEGMGHAGTR